jgi:hypothetical protein
MAFPSADGGVLDKAGMRVYHWLSSKKPSHIPDARFEMAQDLKQSYRGVLCVSCRQPIPVPAIVVTMEAESNEEEQHVRVFNLRCRACEKEQPYRSTDIVDFDGMPRTRRRARLATTVASISGALRRAANA